MIVVYHVPGGVVRLLLTDAQYVRLQEILAKNDDRIPRMAGVRPAARPSNYGTRPA